MSRALFQALLRGYRRSQKTQTKAAPLPLRFTPGVESLGARVMPAVTATFTTGVLSVFGDANDNTIEVSRDAAGAILVNGGAVQILGGTATVANTTQIQVFGQAGNDVISMNEANGALPKANLFGGVGNDTITGGSGADLLFGQGGNDILLGKGGDDSLFGGVDSDTLTGGAGNDQVFGESGNDRMIWGPGDGTDLNEGGAGTDTVEVNGGSGAEQFTATPNGSRVRVDRLSPAPFSLDIGTSESLVVNLNGGDDTFAGFNGLASLIQLTVDGGDGNDTITGGDGNDSLTGGSGNDTVTGGRGTDTVQLGSGDDTFVWNPGDGNDIVEGQDGNDKLTFNGSNASETFDLSANGQRVRFTRNVANIVMDLNGLEAIDVNAFGGADTLTVNNLAGTGLTQVNANLLSLGAGDGAADSIIVNGTSGNDNIHVSGSGTSFTVSGFAMTVTATGSEGANDSVTVNTLAGDDGVTGQQLAAGVVKLTISGGEGNDMLQGSAGNDSIIGGNGNDSISGAAGNDTVLLGGGDDVFEWNPGDGSDTVEGQDGSDKLLFFGSNAGEIFEATANGSRVRMTRDIGNVVMDLNGLENVELRALGGTDTAIVGDLTGAGLLRFDVDMRGPNGDPDGVVDRVIVNGTQGNDNFGIAGDTGGINVFGLSTSVNIFSQEPGNDQVVLNGLGGDDSINAQSLRAGSIGLTMNGGDGVDAIVGSDGNDTILGGRGNDVALMGTGDDTFGWNPGDGNDTVEGQGGTDKLTFNGANVGENFDVSASGQRVRFTRNVANIVMDLNSVEGLDVIALGGADTLTVNDVSGTGLTQINANLAGTGGTGDGAVDRVIVNGTSGDDAIVVVGSGTQAQVVGIPVALNITGAETGNDVLQINALAGDDVIDATALTASPIKLSAIGGDGDDVLLGGDGDDTLSGGNGDDLLIGGPGVDVLDGGPGDNVLIQ